MEPATLMDLARREVNQEAHTRYLAAGPFAIGESGPVVTRVKNQLGGHSAVIGDPTGIKRAEFAVQSIILEHRALGTFRHHTSDFRFWVSTGHAWDIIKASEEPLLDLVARWRYTPAGPRQPQRSRELRDHIRSIVTHVATAVPEDMPLALPAALWVLTGANAKGQIGALALLADAPPGPLAAIIRERLKHPGDRIGVNDLAATIAAVLSPAAGSSPR